MIAKIQKVDPMAQQTEQTTVATVGGLGQKLGQVEGARHRAMHKTGSCPKVRPNLCKGPTCDAQIQEAEKRV